MYNLRKSANRNAQTLLQPKHMGCIWATYGGPGLQHMELFQHMGKKILQKAQHMDNIWVSFSNIWGSFETYRSFLKHMGPF